MVVRTEKDVGIKLGATCKLSRGGAPVFPEVVGGDLLRLEPLSDGQPWPITAHFQHTSKNTWYREQGHIFDLVPFLTYYFGLLPK